MDRTQFLAAIFAVATGGGICASRPHRHPRQPEPFGLPLGASRAELEKLAGPLTEVGPGNFQLAKAPTRIHRCRTTGVDFAHLRAVHDCRHLAKPPAERLR